MKRKYLLFFLPSFVLIAFFYLGPGMIALWYAFTNKTLTGINATQYRFVGFENFIEMFRDPRVGGAAMRTLIFLVCSGLVGQQVLGLLLALLQKGRNKTFVRIIGIVVLIPWIAPEVVGAFCLYAFFGNNGTLNAGLTKFLGMEGITWLFSFPMTTVTIANIWRGTAFSMMIYRAALSSIPSELGEYAYLEGIGIWQKVRYVTLPLIKETIVTNSILVTLGTMGVFGLIYLLTGGGPSGGVSDPAAVFV